MKRLKIPVPGRAEMHNVGVSHERDGRAGPHTSRNIKFSVWVRCPHHGTTVLRGFNINLERVEIRQGNNDGAPLEDIEGVVSTYYKALLFRDDRISPPSPHSPPDFPFLPHPPCFHP